MLSFIHGFFSKILVAIASTLLAFSGTATVATTSTSTAISLPPVLVATTTPPVPVSLSNVATFQGTALKVPSTQSSEQTNVAAPYAAYTQSVIDTDTTAIGLLGKARANFALISNDAARYQTGIQTLINQQNSLNVDDANIAQLLQATNVSYRADISLITDLKNIADLNISKIDGQVASYNDHIASVKGKTLTYEDAASAISESSSVENSYTTAMDKLNTQYSNATQGFLDMRDQVSTALSKYYGGAGSVDLSTAPGQTSCLINSISGTGISTINCSSY